MEEVECKKCVSLTSKLGKLNNYIDKLQKDRDSWAKRHWELVGENAKLRDKLGVISECDLETLKGILHRT